MRHKDCILEDWESEQMDHKWTVYNGVKVISEIDVMKDRSISLYYVLPLLGVISYSNNSETQGSLCM